MSMKSKETLAQLQDNQGRFLDINHSYVLLDDDYDKELLRLVSSSTISDLCSDQLLVYPQSFNQGDGGCRVLEYVERGVDFPAVVYTNNIMGFIGRGDTDIFIHSRFSKENDDYFLHYMLMRVAGLNVFDFETSAIKTKDNWGDFLIYLFPMVLQRALRRGILKSYVSRKYNNANLKGKIDLARHIRLNKPTTGHIAYSVREYSADNIVIQLVRHCLEFLQHHKVGRVILNSDTEIKKAVRLIKELTPSYKASELQQVIAKNRKTFIHPLYAEYRPLQQLCVAILEHRKVSYGVDKNKIHGILFDGAWLWEEYIGIVLQDLMEHRKRYDEKRKIYLLEKGDNKKGFQEIIPDFINKEEKVVGDAKYSMLQGKTNLKSGQAEAIYYKTIMYMYRFQSTKGFLFYPIKQGFEAPILEDFKIVDTEGHLYKVGLPIAETTSFKEFCTQMQDSEAIFKSEIARLMSVKNN